MMGGRDGSRGRPRAGGAHRSILSTLVSRFTLAILIPSGIAQIVGSVSIYLRVTHQAQAMVVADLNAARVIYNGKIRAIESAVRLTAASPGFVAAVAGGDRVRTAGILEEMAGREGLDVLTLTDARGRVIARRTGPEAGEDDGSDDEILRLALDNEIPISGTQVLPADVLRREAPGLAERARTPILPTPRATPTERSEETSGLVLKAAAPVFHPDGGIAGVLYGAELLNGDEELVDRIRDTVFSGDGRGERRRGTATVFLGDLRIATNVPKDGRRATGTRVSDAVRAAVLDRGERWVDEAFVVDAWYITAYEPIRNVSGDCIGILYVGIPRAPFLAILYQTIGILTGVTLLGVALVVAMSVRIARRLGRPLAEIAARAERIADGQVGERIAVEAPAEIGSLARSLETMRARLVDARDELRRWAETLERRVEERSQALEAAQAEAMQSEKLASVGLLASGFAHEVNNPLTGILANASLVLESLPSDAPARAELQVVVDEAIRARDVVRRLLAFSRESLPRRVPQPIEPIVDRAIERARAAGAFDAVRLEKVVEGSLPPIDADGDGLAVVFWNIIQNAVEAMPGGGGLRIALRPLPGEGDGARGIEAEFADTGHGIPDGVAGRVFDPFFTTKETGTGLGLAVSYGIVRHHKGTISLESEPGGGTRVRVVIPASERGEAGGAGEDPGRR
ncbi:MAG: cache domain-containing protein [Planctomycetes bacterium]|nr:cache domain-containing protein [Planctomycetota bacterium]